jgi:uridine kinase
MVIIGVCGGSGSGKTTLVEAVFKDLTLDTACRVSQDSYYKHHASLTYEERCKLNYDHPDAVDYDLFISHLKQLQQGKSVQAPIYSYNKHMRTDKFVDISPRPIALVEGILIFAHPILRKLFTHTIFIDADDDTRLRRRTARDIESRGRTVDEVNQRFTQTILPMHKAFIEPFKKDSDFIFDNNIDDRSRLSSFCNLVRKLIK